LLQQAINFLYRNPRSKLQKYSRFGGYFNYRSMMNARKEMERRSMELPPVTSYADGLPVYFLTGKNYLYQTLYCIQSLVKASTAHFEFILVDDGSFDSALIETMAKQLPAARVITAEQINENLQKVLPEVNYPYLRKKREVYPHLRKLTDVHTIPHNKWKLVLDSDMLFWRQPVEIISWLKDPQHPLHMVDCTEAYGYSQELMELLAGSTVKPLLNVGAIGLKSAAIDWNKLENWIKTMEEQEGGSYYLEQALSAMLIGNTHTTVLKAEAYIVNPSKNQIKNKTGILHHYVDLSKEGYFKQAWKHFLPQ
jgi:glycosyltransferase involved in cell wall biosynthesis